MKFERNGWAGYALGKFNLYSSYNETDVTGNTADGYCWCVKEDLDADTPAFVSNQMEEAIEFCLDNQ